MKNHTTMELVDDLKQKTSKKGHRFWYDKGQPELRLLDCALETAPVDTLLRFVKNLEVIHGTRDTVRLLEYITIVTARSVGTKEEVIDV